MARALVALFALVAAGPALACSGRSPRACLNCEVVAEMHAIRGRPCGIRSISLGPVSNTGGRILVPPRIGKAVVFPGPGYRYISQTVGTDSFVVGFAGRDRFNQPYWVRYRVNVRVTD